MKKQRYDSQNSDSNINAGLFNEKRECDKECKTVIRYFVILANV